MSLSSSKRLGFAYIRELSVAAAAITAVAAVAEPAVAPVSIVARITPAAITSTLTETAAPTQKASLTTLVFCTCAQQLVIVLSSSAGTGSNVDDIIMYSTRTEGFERSGVKKKS